METIQEYKMIISNQTDYEQKYKLIKETSMYVFLQQITKEPTFIYRVHKKTLNVKGIKQGKDGYKFDVPRASKLIKL